jgi:hypothetical protein
VAMQCGKFLKPSSRTCFAEPLSLTFLPSLFRKPIHLSSTGNA